MSGNDYDSGSYMIRRKFYIPKKEVFRDYRMFEDHPSNFILPCDYEETDD